MLKLYVSWQRRRFGLWERSLSKSLLPWSLTWLSSWEGLGLDISSSDSEEGALPVGVNGGDSSWSVARFKSGVSKVTAVKPSWLDYINEKCKNYLYRISWTRLLTLRTLAKAGGCSGEALSLVKVPITFWTIRLFSLSRGVRVFSSIWTTACHMSLQEEIPILT